MDEIAQYRTLHKRGKFRGYSTKFYVDEIGALIEQTGARHLLDYGAGKGFQYTERRYHERWGAPQPVLYDPGVPGLDNLDQVMRAAPYDGVLCIDVLEHIPGPSAIQTLDRLFKLTRDGGFVFVAVHTGPARKTLPDGRNAHLTQRPEDWWQDRMRAAQERSGRDIIWRLRARTE